MSNLYRLVGVGNAELVAGLSELVQQSNALTARVLAHLVELDERRLHLELGFSSLFAYCVEGLGMSEGTAGRRVTATRVCRRFRDAFERVARGELHLCALCTLAPHLSEQNAAELFEASKGKTRRQIEELLAARFPRPDVREQIRRLPARGPVLAARVATATGANGVVEQTLSLSGGFDALCDSRGGRISLEVDEPKGELRATAARLEAPVIAADSAPRQIEPTVTADGPSRPRACELEPLSVGRFGVHFTADAELRDLIERARALASHRVPKGDLAGLMKLMVASFVQQEEKRRFGIGTKQHRGESKARISRGSELTAPPGGASVSSCAGDASTRVAQPTPPELRQAAPSSSTEPAAPLDGASVPPCASKTQTLTAQRTPLGRHHQSEPFGASKPPAPPGGASISSCASQTPTRSARPTPPRIQSLPVGAGSAGDSHSRRRPMHIRLARWSALRCAGVHSVRPSQALRLAWLVRCSEPALAVQGSQSVARAKVLWRVASGREDRGSESRWVWTVTEVAGGQSDTTAATGVETRARRTHAPSMRHQPTYAERAHSEHRRSRGEHFGDARTGSAPRTRSKHAPEHRTPSTPPQRARREPRTRDCARGHHGGRKAHGRVARVLRRDIDRRRDDNAPTRSGEAARHVIFADVIRSQEHGTAELCGLRPAVAAHSAASAALQRIPGPLWFRVPFVSLEAF